MGLFDFFLSEEKQIARHVRRLTNRDSTPEDREGSARWLSDKGTPEALVGMLQRFDLNLEHQLKDSAEKEAVYSLLLGHGKKVLEPAKAWLPRCKQFALPIKLIGEIEGAAAQLDVALHLLEAEHLKDNFKPEKKKALLVWLADVRNPRCIEGALPFLSDFDEGVRYAATEVLLAQGESAREALQAVFSDRPEQSNRLKVRVAEVFAQKGWRLEDSFSTGLPSSFRLKDGRVLSA